MGLGLLLHQLYTTSYLSSLGSPSGSLITPSLPEGWTGCSHAWLWILGSFSLAHNCTFPYLLPGVPAVKIIKMSHYGWPSVTDIPEEQVAGGTTATDPQCLCRIPETTMEMQVEEPVSTSAMLS